MNNTTLRYPLFYFWKLCQNYSGHKYWNSALKVRSGRHGAIHITTDIKHSKDCKVSMTYLNQNETLCYKVLVHSKSSIKNRSLKNPSNGERTKLIVTKILGRGRRKETIMKRSRREMEKRSRIGSAIKELSMMFTHLISLNLFKCECDVTSKTLSFLIMHIVDKVGPTMAVMRQDVNQKIKINIDHMHVLPELETHHREIGERASFHED
ncbi:hypothetical protein JHK82_043463 [Glycine max]|nr:hypothetical protein JHK87_043242 [Glycine soja]KAG5106493.1 hypothetical protein JHK82_043463 [Glycine max]